MVTAPFRPETSFLDKFGGRLKQADAEGRLIIQFAKYNEADKDDDVFKTGSIFTAGENIPMAPYNHGRGEPIGVGRVYSVGDDVLWEGQMFLDYPLAAHTFNVIKAMGPDQEYSFRLFPMQYQRNAKGGLDIASARSTHITPVEIGAGNTTGTRAVKCADCGKIADSGEQAGDAESRITPVRRKLLPILLEV